MTRRYKHNSFQLIAVFITEKFLVMLKINRKLYSEIFFAKMFLKKQKPSRNVKTKFINAIFLNLKVNFVFSFLLISNKVDLKQSYILLIF